MQFSAATREEIIMDRDFELIGNSVDYKVCMGGTNIGIREFFYFTLVIPANAGIQKSSVS